ncbi:hypothetical protein [Hymenobacter terricola]|uniref:hypothetical protein n=1 Tax=Hymenobacter terricola TaxID=2819236 RepID=UPI001B30EDDB|nr:hypothetical protein [Hymenobacter terricola]
MKRLYFALLLALVAISQAAIAQVLTIDGAQVTVQAGATISASGGVLNKVGGTLTNDGTVEVAGDFTNAGTVAAGTGLLRFTGAADQTVTPGGASFYRMEVAKPTSNTTAVLLPASTALIITNQLLLTQGMVRTPATSTVLLPDGATVVGEATGRYVVGNLQVQRAAVTSLVDFGNGLSLDGTGQALGAVTVTRTAGLLLPNVSYGTNLNNNTKGIDRIWTVVPAAQPTAPVPFTLTWLPDDNNGLATTSPVRPWQQATAGTAWGRLGTPSAFTSYTVSATSPTLARFTVSSEANPLPVELLTFEAAPDGPAAVQLRWATASEKDNAGFTVERSLDGLAFDGLGFVAGHGNATSQNTYGFRDAHLPAKRDLLYYRLRQTDLSGQITYSPVRSVRLEGAEPGFHVYPTIAEGGHVYYEYTGPVAPATLEVLDAVGRVVYHQASDGGSLGEVPVAGLASGAYVLRYRTGTAAYQARCVVK